MSKNLQKLIESLVGDVLTEVLRGFNLQEFKNMDSQAKRLYYAGQRLPVIGVGSSRSTFALSGDKVLKVAGKYDKIKGMVNWKKMSKGDVNRYADILDGSIKNSIEKGIAQNREEVSVYTNPVLKPVTTKIFDAADDYSWIISEVAKEFSSGSEFEKATGIASFPVLDAIVDRYRWSSGDKNQKLEAAIDGSAQDLVDPNKYLSQYYLEEDDGEGNVEEAKEWIMDNILGNPTARAIIELIGMGQASGDLLRHEHWGKTADGRVVLLDYGLSEEVFEKFY